MTMYPLTSDSAERSASSRRADLPLRVAVIIVSYNGRADLEECLASLFATADGHHADGYRIDGLALDDGAASKGLSLRVVVVDNHSQDDTVAVIRARFSEVHVVALDRNTGFAEGNNIGWQTIREQWPDTDYVALLNQDTLVAPGWLTPVVRFLEAHPDAGAVQPKLLLHPRTDRINTLGNQSHFLGFGFMSGYDTPDDPARTEPHAITYASGAAVVVRRALLERLGLFDADFFMYLEDADLGWKLRQTGHGVWSVPESVVYHKYRATAPFRSYFWLERNRWHLVLTYYKLPTLLLLAPALFLMECGQLLFAWRQGLLFERARVLRELLSRSFWKAVRAKRRLTQSRRTQTDAEFLRPFHGAVHFAPVDGFLLRYVANPLFAFYWAIVRRVLWW